MSEEPTLALSGCDIWIGDVLHGWREKTNVSWQPMNRNRPVVVESIDQSSGMSDWTNSVTGQLAWSNLSGIVWLVYRPEPNRIEKKPDSRWNGRCLCGANTFSLFTSVEHEGPCLR